MEPSKVEKMEGFSTGQDDSPGHSNGPVTFWEVMTRKGSIVFFLLFLPILWTVFIGVGWSMDDKVEERVFNIWTRQRSDFAKDIEYSAKYDRDAFPLTSFAAMAISRDGTNLFTKERLEEIRTRMEEAESTTVEYNGNVYTWDDVCSSNNAGPGTAYMFPCPRLSPMDYFQESRWFFQEVDRLVWYRGLFRKLLLAPRLPRFGVLQGVCSSLTAPTGRTECDTTIINRLLQGNPLALFADIGNLENNDPCKMCIEEEYENTMDQLHDGTRQLFQGLVMYATLTGQTDLTTMYTNILANLDRQGVIDFFTYYVVRSTYIELGALAFQQSYDQFSALISGCTNEGSTVPCPDPISQEDAKQALADHADHTFSSTVTSGNPLPLWGNGGEGYLLQGTSPVGGSGINLSGTMFSAAEFFQLQSPTAQDWVELVEGDPVYKWFVASQTPMTGHCGNGYLKGTSGFGDELDAMTNAIVMQATQKWCTKYNVPFGEDEERTVQHFARMWYDLLVDSPSFLNVVQGQSDPYVWTTGQGCGYNLGGERYSYTNSTSQEELMENASGELYYIDEGASVGVVDKNMLIGGRVPRDSNVSNPLEEVSVIQTLYPAAIPPTIVDRVKNCNRPQGSIDITEEDAEEVLFRFKEKFEEVWTRDWDDDDSGDVSFVGYFDDSGVIGTTGRMLKEITLSNGDLIVVSILIIAAFSVIFLVSTDMVESRILITLLGVALVLLAFFAAVGFCLIIGIKINITIAWTLPFIMLGLGVDDMYIVLLALREQPGYALKDFKTAMKEVIIPVSMTSLVNAGMFAIMNVNDIPAIYLTAQVGLVSVAFLYLTVIFCFSAWCFLDMKRQGEGRYDIFWCRKSEVEHRVQTPMWAHFCYDKLYRPLILDGAPAVIALSHLIIWAIAAVVFGFGIWGLTEGQREIGLGLEEFFPTYNQASRWASMRTEELASWSLSMRWGAVDYTNPESQMKVIKQFEDVVGTSHISEVDTKQLWLADFLIWTTYQCTDNFDRLNPDFRECGIDQIYPVDNSTCSGTWEPNTLGLREKVFAEMDTCVAYEGGICRPSDQMHPSDLEMIESVNGTESWCPVVKGWSNEKLGYCIGQWRQITGGGGRLVLENATGTPTACTGEYLNDEKVVVPIPYAEGPTMFALDLFTHQITIDMIEETRQYCDYDPEIHCWLSGIPYDYWSQYIGIYDTFVEIGAISISAGFVISFFFLIITISLRGKYTAGKNFVGGLCGALLITLTSALSLVSVSGISSLFGVSFTGFSTMSFVLSVGFSVEYSVHIVARWLLADHSLTTSLSRVEYAMEFLFLPTFMSWVSSVIGVATLAFTDFEFNEVYFFRPLMVVMLVTYFFGCYWLPVFLCLLDFDQVKFGEECSREAVASSDPEGKGVPMESEEDKDVSETGKVQGSPKGSSNSEKEDISGNPDVSSIQSA